MENSKKETKKSTLREYAEAIIIALVLALFIRTFIVQAFKIPSGSMKETLKIGDHILVNKFIFGPRIPYTDLRIFSFTKPKRGDVIVFLEPTDKKKDFIKRVIGLPGETLEVKDRQVYINGETLEEVGYVNHLKRPFHSPLDKYGPIEIPENSYFMMGDNRENSSDSRVWGTLPFELIKGKAFMIYWSWDGPNRRVRWKRIGDIIHGAEY